MSRSTISTFQLFQMFPDEETARLYLESRLWPKGVTCPTCAGQDRITPRKAGFHRCNRCQIDFTIRTGTIFERSHIPLHKWLYAMYLLVTARKGISSMQITKEIGVQQKSAWFGPKIPVIGSHFSHHLYRELVHLFAPPCTQKPASVLTIDANRFYFRGRKRDLKSASRKAVGARPSLGTNGTTCFILGRPGRLSFTTRHFSYHLVREKLG
jgi:transposase-like protein